MIYSRLRIAACLILVAVAQQAAAFSLPSTAAAAHAVRGAFAPSMSADSTMPCAAPEYGVLMNDVPVTGSTLRSMDLADASGARVRVDSLIGTEGKAVVVFLRHLG